MKRILLGMPAVISAFADAGALIAQSYENNFGTGRSFNTNLYLSTMNEAHSKFFPPKIARLDTLKKEFGGYYTFAKGIKFLHCEIVPGLMAVVKGSRSGRALSYTLEWDREAWIVAAKSKWAVKDSVTQVYSHQSEVYSSKFKLFMVKLDVPLLDLNRNIVTSMETLMFESIFGQKNGLKRVSFLDLNRQYSHLHWTEIMETGKLAGLNCVELDYDA